MIKLKTAMEFILLLYDRAKIFWVKYGKWISKSVKLKIFEGGGIINKEQIDRRMEQARKEVFVHPHNIEFNDWLLMQKRMSKTRKDDIYKCKLVQQRMDETFIKAQPLGFMAVDIVRAFKKLYSKDRDMKMGINLYKALKNMESIIELNTLDEQISILHNEKDGGSSEIHTDSDKWVRHQPHFGFNFSEFKYRIKKNPDEFYVNMVNGCYMRTDKTLQDASMNMIVQQDSKIYYCVEVTNNQ